jgi:threonine-phosphate decarboxylase
MKHGGDLLSYAKNFNGKLIDFSSNINPLGYPEGIEEALIKSFGELTSYPDIKYRSLKKAVSNYLGCDGSEIVLGNGAIEIINNISIMFDRVIVVTPCFSEYIERPQIYGKQVLKLPLREDFSIDLELIKENIRAKDLIILGNPNNPTGRRIQRDLLLNIHELVRDNNAFLLLDEAFYEFCPKDYDSIALFRNSNNICVIRAATKFFALPGIRLGYGFAAREFVERYNLITMPWSINSFASAAGEIILKDYDYINKSKEYIKEQREKLLTELLKVDSIRPFETHANFILIKLLYGNEDEIFDFFIKRGIMIRKASTFQKLDKSFIRIAVKSLRDNEYLIKCLKEY